MRVRAEKEGGGGFERGAVIMRFALFIDDLAQTQELGVEFAFRAGLKKVGVADACSTVCDAGLAQDVLDSFEAGCERLEVLRGPDLRQRGEPVFDIDQIVVAGCEDGVDLVVFEAAEIFEVKRDAVQQEFFELL